MLKVVEAITTIASVIIETAGKEPVCGGLLRVRKTKRSQITSTDAQLPVLRSLPSRDAVALHRGRRQRHFSLERPDPTSVTHPAGPTSQS
jgi:hypothetical protein